MGLRPVSAAVPDADFASAARKALIDSMADAVLIADENGLIQLFNAACGTLFGYGLGELPGRRVSALLPDIERLWADDERDPRPRVADTIGKRKDGAPFPAVLSLGEIGDSSAVVRVVVIRDVSARDAGQRELAATRDAAVAASEAKTHFLAQMSHELRTPLNAVLGFADMMKQELYGPVKPARYGEYIGNILTSGKHLLALIDDLLDISKIEVGKLVLHEERVDLADALQFALLSVEAARRDKSIHIATSFPPSPRAITGDARLCRQISANLLSNAIKYTPAGGYVTLAIEDLPDGGLALVVSDTGIGIPADKLPLLGTPFLQIRDSYRRGIEGTGLGLALTKKFAELHNAAMRIDSESGRGTTVRICFPAERRFKLGHAAAPPAT